METSLKKRTDESVNQYIWRLASAKDEGLIDYTWPELADIFNHEFGDDNKSEATYRKVYQAAKKFYDDVFSKSIDDEQAAELREERYALYEERTKLRDERNALRAMLRAKARTDANIDMWSERIERLGEKQFPSITAPIRRAGDKEVLCCVADIHYGMQFDNFLGTYNSEVAAKRMAAYAEEVIRIGKESNATTCTVTVLGDCISGNIHRNVQVANRENVIDQIVGCSEVLASFVHTLTRHYTHVNVNAVTGNHTRIDSKDDAIKDERLDRLVIQYVKAALSHLPSVAVTTTNDVDTTVASFDICGKKYVSVHGDYDTMDERGISKLCMWLGYRPDYVLYGHMHHPQMKFCGDVCAIMCGCLSGAGDDYTVEKRLRGDAYQVVCVCDANGVESIHPVNLCR